MGIWGERREKMYSNIKNENLVSVKCEICACSVCVHYKHCDEGCTPCKGKGVITLDCWYLIQRVPKTKKISISGRTYRLLEMIADSINRLADIEKTPVDVLEKIIIDEASRRNILAPLKDDPVV